ncbi:phenylalanine-tRNA ligase, beta subunit [Helcococcus kunzii ATCC 51366]|uniref:Phenylalanine--tRNA ligase beta subunit n=1 Tax=Helcococcus kunzii ATCC 51366 TaxID=883114 RepID=H3NMQ2_9FIRM|nr:phenylalanine--tRNA ligase subunit beta [Helcococcus kunzii]EHR34643.1 phenylalanine-tRNA ligase, beta subunit [Helcococcus kunzii ATCC 51366]QUY64556.1 phenylalanine--tRNA ligase subunit beta [Helcococcus kunzii]
MLVPIKWLREYVEIKDSTREIANRVTDSGSHVESIEKYEEMSGLVIAKILDIRKHENADKLSLVDLDYGDGKETIVTGAKNMRVGDNVVLAKVGAKLPGGIEIKKATLQGVVSPGMLCGYSELGVSENYVDKRSADGLIILDDDVKVGEDAVKALNLDSEIIEFEITPNRPDCLSIIGMAREVAAVFDEKIKEPSLEVKNAVSNYKEFFNGVELNTDKSTRFMTAVVKDVEIKESPLYIKNYLRDAGMRPINNIVDIANFIMLEYGQPLHTYDLDTISGKKLIVREGKTGETVKTLDKNERKIEAGDILICDDDNNPIGIAGVMGGFDTEVTENTKNILIESATFNNESIRKTSKRLGLRSEASARFEKGIPAKLNEIALKRFLHLIEETNSGIVVEGLSDDGDFEVEEKSLKLRNSKLNSLLGIDLDIEQSKKYLDSLELYTEIEGDTLNVKIPFFRSDLNIEEDLIEEIGRLYGFQNIAPKSLVGGLTQGIKSEMRQCQDEARINLFALGFSEILTYSFISNKVFDKLNLNENDKLRDTVKILNPLGEDFSVMRTTLIGNMLEIIRRNLNNKQNDLRFFEVGNSFIKRDETIKEEKLMTFSLVGDYDFYYIKNILINIFTKFGIEDYEFIRETENPIFHEGRCANVMVDGEKVAVIGEISPIVMDNFDIEKRVNLVEANLDVLFKFKKDQIRYKEISKYPIVERDIAIVVDKDIQSQDIINVIKQYGGEYLKYVKLFDIYKGEQIPEDKVSLAYKIGFQSNEMTLKDQVVKEAFENIVEGLNKTFDVNLRS